MGHEDKIDGRVNWATAEAPKAKMAPKWKYERGKEDDLIDMGILIQHKKTASTKFF
ncbi:unnamed protein product [Larinioides sclopetarius]|uniref:Uncharacterized protein n=1 Tax=Larinioides sclopetarius TaxID=280406 RepID=A0AAV1ZAI6_9ARAC